MKFCRKMKICIGFVFTWKQRSKFGMRKKNIISMQNCQFKKNNNKWNKHK